jgi:hypothetical protein
MRRRMGELLKGMVPMTDQDVQEILEEQRSSGRRFGEIAMAWGLCEPEHVWLAWCNQAGRQLERVRLLHIGVDAQAPNVLSRAMAERHTAIPVRVFDRLVVVAIADPAQQQSLRNHLQTPGREVRFVLAHPADIQWAIDVYYQPLAVSA